MSSTHVPPHYECLGVDPSISSAELSRHYKKLSLQLHPDRAAYRNDAANEANVQARYQRITEAYAVLSDPEKRSSYDTQHGVNFQSRLTRLQAAIGQHNASTTQRNTKGEAPVERTNLSSSVHDTQEPASKREGQDYSVDDDDDYVPESMPSATAKRNTKAEPELDTSERRSSADVSSEEEGEEEGERIRQLFSMQPSLSASGTSEMYDGSPQPSTRYRGVTLTRRLPATASPQACEADATWGLDFEGNVLVGFKNALVEGEEEGAAPHDVEGLHNVLFPAVVTQLNNTMVRDDADVRDLLHHMGQKTHAQQRRAAEKGLGSSADDAKGHHQQAEETLSTADSSAEENTESLYLVLSYSVEAYDMIGDSRLLGDAALLDEAVPRWCVTAEMPSLLPSSRVLAVNEVAVNTADELREALRALSVADSCDGSGAAAQKRPRTAKAIVIECCSLPFE